MTVTRRWLQRIGWGTFALLLTVTVAHIAVALGWVTYRSLIDWGWKSAATITATFTVGRKLVDNYLKEVKTERAARLAAATALQESARLAHEQQQEINKSVVEIAHDLKNVRMVSTALYEELHTNGGGAVLQRVARMERNANNVFALWRTQTPIATWEAIVDPADPTGETMIATGISPAWVELTGISSPAQLMDGWRDIVSVDHEERVAERFRIANENQTRCIVEFDLVNFVTKEVQPVHWIGTPQFDEYDDKLTGWTVQVFSMAKRRASDKTATVTA